MFSVKFSASAEANGAYSFKLYIDSCYEATGSMKTIPFTYDKGICTVSGSTAVGDVIAKINAAAQAREDVEEKLSDFSNARLEYNNDIQNIQKRINVLNAKSALLEDASDPPKYDYTDLGELISIAEQAYTELKPSERLVAEEQYKTLAELIKLYNDCKRELEIFTSEIEVNSFKSTHAYILAKTQETVQISDKVAVNSAISAYDSSTYAAKVLLHNEINLLKRLLSRIEALESDDGPTNIKRITEEEIPKLQKNYEGILSFTDSDINEENAYNTEIMKVVNDAYDAVNTQMIIDAGYEYLYQEIFDKISDIKTKLDKLAGRSSQYENVTRFNEDFRDLKKKSVEDITLLDRDEIMQAYYLLGMMSNAELAEVGQDTVDKINEMVTMIGELELLEDDSGETVTLIETVEKVVTDEIISVISGGKETVYVPGQSMYQFDKTASSGWLSLGLGNTVRTVRFAIICSFITMLIFAATVVASIILQRKINRKEAEIDNAQNFDRS